MIIIYSMLLVSNKWRHKRAGQKAWDHGRSQILQNLSISGFCGCFRPWFCWWVSKC